MHSKGRSSEGEPDADAGVAAETLRQIGDVAGISVWTWHAATDRVYHAASTARGTTLDQGMALSETLARLHPGDRARVKRRLSAAVRSGKSGTFRFRSAPRGNEIRQCYATHFPVGPNEVQVIVQDVTRTQRAEEALRESEAFARSILEASTMAIEVLDAEGRLIFMNGPGIEIMEVDDFEAIKGLSFDQFWPDEVQPVVRQAIAAARAGGTVRHTLFGPTAKGKPRWWDLSVSPIVGEDGKVARLLALSRDVTEAKHNEAEVVAGARRLANVLESTMDSVISVDRNWTITYLNQRAKSVFPHDVGSLIGRDVHDFFDPAEAAPFFLRYEEAMANHGSIAFEEYLPSAGTWFEIQAYGSQAGLNIFFRDVTERRLAQERITHLARHDTLTGLPNRMHFQHELDAALAALGQRETLAVLSIDLDDFKQVNDTLGHPAGDALLREVAARMRRSVAGTDLAARLGGDEFAVLTRIRGPEDAARTARAILRSLAEPHAMDDQIVGTGASIGIALAPRDGRTSEALLHAADVALYRVKGHKGQDFRFFEAEMDHSLRERRQLKYELSRALLRDELALVFQPQVDIADSRLTGFEALLRWHHPVRGTISPAIFIPLAEESGLIEPIGAFALKAACAEAVGWPETVALAVNLSPAQFRSGQVVRAVADALAASGLAPQRLELEITESVLLDQSAEAVEALTQLHQLGVRVALDDFGTGYSSLSYLRRFPFDKIKIDRSFVADLPAAEDSAAIVRAIIGLGRSLKTRVTAEGVESWEQLLMLRAEGCNEAQGYLFSRPLPSKQARKLAESGLAAPPELAEPRKRHA